MAHTLNTLALDFGAESGRALLGQFDGQRLALTDIHRFANGPVRLPDGLHWDVLRLWTEIKTSLAKAARAQGQPLAGIGIDTWGVDFALLDRQNALIGNPHHYRDDRTDGMMEAVWRRVPKEQIFAQTGIQFMQLNTLYQLYAMVTQQSPALAMAETFLTIPDLFNFWLTGVKACEFSHATTTQCYDPRRKDWAWPLLHALDIPSHIFPQILPPGTVRGPLLPSIAEETGAQGLQVLAPACHDTGSAVVAVPAERPGFAWISSGTWSIVGAETPAPIITADSLRHNFTNEGGAGGSFRFCKNIMGLWLVQECRRWWAAHGEELSYTQLTQLAGAARPFTCLLDPDDDDFLKPGDMPARIRAYAVRTGQTVPQTHGEIVRSALESIALKYRYTLEKLEEMLGHPLAPIHIVGGGTQNRLLSQFTADAANRPVLTGPIEATAMGNCLLQAVALGHLGSLWEARAVVRNSGELLSFEPGERGGWDEAYARFLQLMGSL
jgi:rhamnulokinase